MITAKEARELSRKNSLPKEVVDMLDRISMGVQLACSTGKTEAYFKFSSLSSTEIEILRNKLMTLGYGVWETIEAKRYVVTWGA